MRAVADSQRSLVTPPLCCRRQQLLLFFSLRFASPPFLASQEMAWASHLGVPAVMAPTPRGSVANYAMHVNQTVQSASGIHLWVTVPLAFPLERDNPASLSVASNGAASAAGANAVVARTGGSLAQVSGSDTEMRGAAAHAGGHQGAGCAEASCHATAPHTNEWQDPWCAWNALRTMTEAHPHVSIVLEITEQLPSRTELERWLAEPVKAAILPTSIFITNRHGFPTLAKEHQAFVQALHVHNVQLLLRGRPQAVTPTSAPAAGGASDSPPSYKPYLQYVTHVLRRVPPLSEMEHFEAPYYDCLQAPLQPLMDNLESQTYETFERDPVKYDQYEAAAHKALAARPAGSTTVVMVVGAGRGPLVRRVLAAAESAKRAVRVYAVEKNPNAVVT